MRLYNGRGRRGHRNCTGGTGGHLAGGRIEETSALLAESSASMLAAIESLADRNGATAGVQSQCLLPF